MGEPEELEASARDYATSGSSASPPETYRHHPECVWVNKGDKCKGSILNRIPNGETWNNHLLPYTKYGCGPFPFNIPWTNECSYCCPFIPGTGHPNPGGRI